jgi:hypothetical protein
MTTIASAALANDSAASAARTSAVHFSMTLSNTRLSLTLCYQTAFYTTDTVQRGELV